jgi:hypothetical protein
VSSPKTEGIIANAPGELAEALTVESKGSVYTVNGEFENYVDLTTKLLRVSKPETSA